MNDIKQNILVILKFFGPTNHGGAKIKVRLGVPHKLSHSESRPDSAYSRFLPYDHSLNSMQEMAATRIYEKVGIEPVSQVQLSSRELGLVYEWWTNEANNFEKLARFFQLPLSEWNYKGDIE